MEARGLPDEWNQQQKHHARSPNYQEKHSCSSTRIQAKVTAQTPVGDGSIHRGPRRDLRDNAYRRQRKAPPPPSQE